MRRMIDYQAKEDLFAFIASYHAITTVQEGPVLREGIIQAAVDFLSLGLDPAKCTFWVQSDVPEVAELAWLLSTSITVSQLELAHSYKDKTAQGIPGSAGLFTYPVLMAADILLFGAQKVPVGKDQKQHLEISRDIAQRFNHRYGVVFVVPEPDILRETALVPGVDGRKMSKSYNNAIYFFADEKELKKSVMSIMTDSKGVNDAKDPDASVLYQIYSLFLEEKDRAVLADRFRTPGTGYGDLKKELLARVLETFGPFRAKRAELLAHLDDVRDQLSMGAKKARSVAAPFLEKARSATGLAY